MNFELQGKLGVVKGGANGIRGGNRAPAYWIFQPFNLSIDRQEYVLNDVIAIGWPDHASEIPPKAGLHNAQQQFLFAIRSEAAKRI